MPLLSDVVLIFLNSIVALTRNWKFFGLYHCCIQWAMLPLLVSRLRKIIHQPSFMINLCGSTKRKAAWKHVLSGKKDRLWTQQFYHSFVAISNRNTSLKWRENLLISELHAGFRNVRLSSLLRFSSTIYRTIVYTPEAEVLHIFVLTSSCSEHEGTGDWRYVSLRFGEKSAVLISVFMMKWLY